LFGGLIEDLEEWKQTDAEFVNECWTCRADAFSSQQLCKYTYLYLV